MELIKFMEICVISPHIDDAFLSLHTYLSKLKEQGEDILVVNVFSRTNFSKIGTSVEEKTRYRKQEELETLYTTQHD